MNYSINSNILDLNYYLPTETINNHTLNNHFPEWSIEKIESKTGISQRHISGSCETSLDLGVNAAKLIIGNNQELLNKIDGLLFCTQSPDFVLPPNACIAQNFLNLRKDILATDFSLGCSGFVFGLSLADSLIKSSQAKCILLITAETYSKYIASEDKTVKTIFGDAGAATIISASNKQKISSFSFYTDGSGYQNLIVPDSGAARNKDYILSKSCFSDAGRTPKNLYMNGPEIFKFTLDVVPRLLNDCLEKTHCSFDDIDFFILHQANKFMLDSIRIKCRIPNEKFVVDMSDIGNTVSCSIPIALKRNLDNGKIKSGDRIFIAGFGVGYSACATIIEV